MKYQNQLILPFKLAVLRFPQFFKSFSFDFLKEFYFDDNYFCRIDLDNYIVEIGYLSDFS